MSRIKLEDALQIVDLISPTLISDRNDEFDWGAMKALLKYYADQGDGTVLIMAEIDRKLSRSKSGDRSGISILGSAELRALVREPTRTEPALILLKQVGGPALEWRAGPFWWPMLASPPQAKSCVFATKVSK
jgi:hypothetical protein